MTVDRIFLDANILFSAAYGSPGLNHLWKIARQKQCLLFASHFVVEEARRNLYQPEQKKWLEESLLEVRIVPEADPTLPCPVGLPEKDRPVLMAAILNKADYLMTGDSTHFGKYFGQTMNGVTICRPRDYLANKLLRKKK